MAEEAGEKEKVKGSGRCAGVMDAEPLIGAEPAPAAAGASDSPKETAAGGGGKWVHMPGQ